MHKAFFLWTYLMIFVSFAEAVSMYLVFFQEQRKTFLPLEKQYVIIVRKRSVAFSRKFFFFLVNSNMVNLLSFSVLSSVWVVCFDLWLFDKNSSFGRANCFYWSKSWHFWSRCGFLVTTLLQLLHFDRKNKTKIQSQQFLKGVSL